MVMNALRKGASGGIGKFILFGFLVLAVAGLALTDIGGFFRGGAGSNNVLKVSGETVSIQSFDSQARRRLAQLGISPQEAYTLGYMDQIIAGNIREILMHDLANQSDIAIERDRIAEHIHELILPLTNEEQNAQSVLLQILRNQGMSEKEFANAIAFEMKNELISNAIAASAPRANPLLVDNLYQFQSETRNVEYLKFHDSEIQINTPDEAALKERYESTKEIYRIPETRNIQIVVIDDKDILEDLSLEAEDILDRKYERADSLEEMLMEGTPVEEIAKTVPVEIINVDQLAQNGQSHSTEALEDFSDNLIDITENAFSLEEGEASPTFETADGNLAAVILTEINSEGYHAFDKVKQQIESGMIKDAQSTKTQESANNAFDVITAEGTDLKKYADKESRTHRTAETLTRGKLTEPFNDKALQAIFEAQTGKPFLTEIDGGVAIVSVTDINIPQITDSDRESEDYKALENALNENVKGERLATLIEYIHSKSPAKINRPLLDRAYGQNDDSQ
jgi:hypothetical protein